MSTFVNTVDTVGDAALASSIIDRSITELLDDKISVIGDYAFFDCTLLTTINCVNAESIGTAAFQNCKSLKRATFPNVKTLNTMTFRDCSALKVVDFGALEQIGLSGTSSLYTFDNATSLETLIIRTNSRCTILGQNFRFPSGYLYVPAALVEEYKTRTGWTSFADRIRAIEDYPEVCA